MARERCVDDYKGVIEKYEVYTDDITGEVSDELYWFEGLQLKKETIMELIKVDENEEIIRECDTCKDFINTELYVLYYDSENDVYLCELCIEEYIEKNFERVVF